MNRVSRQSAIELDKVSVVNSVHRVMTINSLAFKGDIISYPGVRHSTAWGVGYVDNKKRSHRSRPLHLITCPFCKLINNSQDILAMNLIQFNSANYLVIENANPIVEHQLVIFPYPNIGSSDFSDHRADLNSTDVELLEKLTKNGFTELNCSPVSGHPSIIRAENRSEGGDIYSQPYAVYVNPLPGSGRSVPHLHINCVPARLVPLPEVTPAPWQICQDKENGTIFSRAMGFNFYGLVVQGQSASTVAQTLARFHEAMNNWSIAYNLIAFPESVDTKGLEAQKNQIIVIPRDHEHCEAADQKVAGLEFLTGVLIPGANRIGSMDTLQRDKAFGQATLKPEQCLALERKLRNDLGLPPTGIAVYAVKDERHLANSVQEGQHPLYRAAIQSNRELEKAKISDWCSSTSEIEPALPKNFLTPNILIRITRASICQSDRRVLRGSKAHDLAKEGGLILGHEAGGYVVDPGPWQAELAVGTKVIVLPHLTCGNCDACRSNLQNLCVNMQHLGFHLHGTLAELMNFPYQCILPVAPSFPDDALPLVEPLACVLRPLFRIKELLAKLAKDHLAQNHDHNVFTIYGAGPMGCLAARAIKRFWPNVWVKMIEPRADRRQVVEQNEIADQVVEQLVEGEENDISFVSSSALKASVGAVQAARPGGTVILFSGINTEDISDKCGKWNPLGVTLERIHRLEQSVTLEEPLGKRCYLLGTSGYNFNDTARSVQELQHHYHHYRVVQNALIDGLGADTISILTPKQSQMTLSNVVETMLAPNGVEDDVHGPMIAKIGKVLIKLDEKLL